MKQCVTSLEGVSPLPQSRNYTMDFPKLEKETHDAYEKRTWKNRLHVNEKGMVFIPPMAFKNCLSECAKYLAMQQKINAFLEKWCLEHLPGKGKATYTKHFEAGVLVTDPVDLDVKAEDVKGQWLYVPAEGKREGSKRVWKCFPVIPKWKADVLFYILDETITEDVFRYYLEQAGKFIGVGCFRPRNNVFWGRFKVVGEIVFE